MHSTYFLFHFSLTGNTVISHIFTNTYVAYTELFMDIHLVKIRIKQLLNFIRIKRATLSLSKIIISLFICLSSSSGGVWICIGHRKTVAYAVPYSTTRHNIIIYFFLPFFTFFFFFFPCHSSCSSSGDRTLFSAALSRLSISSRAAAHAPSN